MCTVHFERLAEIAIEIIVGISACAYLAWGNLFPKE
jgi:hypothetical protein